MMQKSQESLAEVQSQLLVTRDVNYFTSSDIQMLAIQSVECHKVLTGLINATKARAS